MRAAALVLLVALGLSACRSPLGPPKGARLLTVDAGAPPRQYSGSSLTARERVVVRDSAHMAQVWPKLTQGSMPSVDFRNSVLIVAGMGSRASGGYSIQVTRAWLVDGITFIEVEETSPGSNCATTDAFTSPAVAAVVEGASPVVEFIERSVVRHC